MSAFKSKKSLDALYEEAEYYKVEGEVNDLKARSLERKKVCKELEKEYGSGWQKLLGLTSKSSIESLKSFLTKFKVKSKETHVVGGGRLSPLPCVRPDAPMGNFPKK